MLPSLKCQELVLIALVNLDRAGEFETADALISDEIEELGGIIKMVSDSQQTTSNVTDDQAKASRVLFKLELYRR